MKSQFRSDPTAAETIRFALVADTHVNPEDGRSNSPWSVNRLANGRTADVIARVAAERPDFVVHLGDMVHPVPGTPGYPRAAERFFQLTEPLGQPCHVVAGNHDAGDKPIRWSPASPISDQSLAEYEEVFGQSYYAFDHPTSTEHGLRVVVINTMLINAGNDAEQAQRRWLEDQLRSSTGTRTFVMGHYPLFLAERDEPECYDNIAEPGRSWLLDLFEAAGVEAYFSGHVHNFFYNRHGVTDLYVLPSTSFVRHDYSELARIPPGPEFGRDDTAKLGYAMVEVHPDHHRVHVVRSPDPVPGEEASESHRVSIRDTTRAPVGMDMREHWADRVTMPYNGMLDEFTRRTVRNDYPLLALWETGLSTLRIPLHDLLDPVLERRMGDLVAAGHGFQVFCYDLPRGATLDLLERHSASVDAVELILPPEAMHDSVPLSQLRERIDCPVIISPLATSASHDEQAGAVFTHQVRHGHTPGDEVQGLGPHGLGADGVGFRVGAADMPWDGIQLATTSARAAGLRANVHVTLAGMDPAANTSTAGTAASRVAETVLAAWESQPWQVLLDTLADVDRGYFPRHGLVDRRHNPTDAGRVLRHLQGVLSRLTRSPDRPWRASVPVPGGRICSAAGDEVVLVLPDGDEPGAEVAGTALAAITPQESGVVIDLHSGQRRTGVTLHNLTSHHPVLLLLGPEAGERSREPLA